MLPSNPKLHSNVRKLYLLNLLVGIVFWYPIEKLYLQHLGAGPLGISINALIFLLTVIMFDVPSGVLADKWKRKNTLLLAICCFVVSCIMGGLSHTWVQYLPMNVLLGGFVVLTSGTFQAMMFDSLKDSGHQHHYDKYQGRSYALFLAGLGLSSLVGGYLAQWFSMRATYFITAAVMLPAIIVALLLKEPQSHKRVADQKLRQHVQRSVRLLMGERLLLQLALLVTAMGLVRGAYTEYSGLLFVVLGMTAIPLGYAGAGKWLISSLGQLAAPKVGRQALRFAPLFFVIFLIFSLIHNSWGLVFFFISGFLYSMIANQAEASVQDASPSEIRATTLSVLSFTSNIVLVPLGLLFGWIAQKSNVFNAYTMIAIVGMIYLIIWLSRGRSVLRQLYSAKETKRSVPTMEDELTKG
jgi:predicted MFS family arabinose efflux permease